MLVPEGESVTGRSVDSSSQEISNSPELSLGRAS